MQQNTLKEKKDRKENRRCEGDMRCVGTTKKGDVTLLARIGWFGLLGDRKD